MPVVVVGIAVVVGGLVARAGDDDELAAVATTTAQATSGGSSTPTVRPTNPDGSPAFPDGFGTVRVTVAPGGDDDDAVEGCLLLADTPQRRVRGLMGVTDEDLAGYDGMLFRFEQPTAVGFWMRNTRIPLSIAYFDDAGQVVSITDMEPCPDDSDCPTYPAGGPVKWAIEVPQGELDELEIDETAVLTDTGSPCTP